MILSPVLQGRRQNLKEVPPNFTENFNIDDVTANEVIERNQRWKEENLKFFSVLWQKHCHSKIPGAWLCMYVSITVLF